MNTPIQALIDFGFSPKEAHFYLVALELGQFSIAGIATKSGIKRPTCYVLVENLMKRGFITAIPRASKTLYTAEDPDQLLNEVQKQVDKVTKLLPTLKSLRKSEHQEPMVKFFRGRAGIEAIYSEMIRKKPREIYSILDTDQLIEVAGEAFIGDWINKRIRDNIHVTNIQVPSKKFKDKYHSHGNQFLRTTKFLSPSTKLPASISFYEDKVAVISSKEDDFSFTVSSKEFTQTMHSIFKELWNQLPEIKD